VPLSPGDFEKNQNGCDRKKEFVKSEQGLHSRPLKIRNLSVFIGSFVALEFDVKPHVFAEMNVKAPLSKMSW